MAKLRLPLEFARLIHWRIILSLGPGAATLVRRAGRPVKGLFDNLGGDPGFLINFGDLAGNLEQVAEFPQGRADHFPHTFAESLVGRISWVEFSMGKDQVGQNRVKHLPRFELAEVHAQPNPAHKLLASIDDT